MASDADDHGRQERHGREHQGSAWPGRHQDRPEHDGHGESQEHLEDLTFTVHGYDGQEAAGDDEAEGVEGPQASHRQSGAPAQDPEQAHR
jgi:hypothetical protein